MPCVKIETKRTGWSLRYQTTDMAAHLSLNTPTQPDNIPRTSADGIAIYHVVIASYKYNAQSLQWLNQLKHGPEKASPLRRNGY